MKILALECSAGPSSCAIVQDGKVLASNFMNVQLTHSQTLLPMVQRALNDTGISVNDLDVIAVSAGPGSFTGVRIGVATVKGLAFANHIPCAAVSTLAAMAHVADGAPFDGIVCCVMDARCQQVYTASFLCEGGKLSRLTEDEAIAIADLKERLKNEKKDILLVGDGSELCYTKLSNLPTVRLAPPHLRYQTAVGVAYEAALMAEREALTDADKLLPFYLRLPQAERELRKKQSDNTL